MPKVGATGALPKPGVAILGSAVGMVAAAVSEVKVGTAGK